MSEEEEKKGPPESIVDTQEVRLKKFETEEEKI